MPSNVVHGREGVLKISTDTGSTAAATEIGYTNSWSLSMSRDLAEITKLNQNSKEYVEGLVSGTVSAQGSIRAGDSAGLNVLFSRFAKVMSSLSTGGGDSEGFNAIQDGNLYLHMIMKPIDTAKTSDAAKGSKFTAAILSNGLSVDAGGGDIESWSYDGTINGDLLYSESTDTASGIPKKVQ